jgi:hypothetical protein
LITLGGREVSIVAKVMAYDSRRWCYVEDDGMGGGVTTKTFTGSLVTTYSNNRLCGHTRKIFDTILCSYYRQKNQGL